MEQKKLSTIKKAKQSNSSEKRAAKLLNHRNEKYGLQREVVEKKLSQFYQRSPDTGQILLQQNIFFINGKETHFYHDEFILERFFCYRDYVFNALTVCLIFLTLLLIFVPRSLYENQYIFTAFVKMKLFVHGD